MKLIVILSLITIVACNIPDAFVKTPIYETKGKNCICRAKECTDVSCEEKNCLNLNKALKILQASKDAKYPKKWVEGYLQLVQERCLCIKGCEKICSPKEFIECSAAAFDRFYCKFQAYVSGLTHQNGFNLFLADIDHILVTTINQDCKPICSGEGDCNPFYEEPNDCGCTKNCVNKYLKSLAHSLKDDNAKVLIEEFVIYVDAYYGQYTICKKSLKEGQKKICLSMAKNEIDRALEELFQELSKAVGPCSAISIISAIKQAVYACLHKK